MRPMRVRLRHSAFLFLAGALVLGRPAVAATDGPLAPLVRPGMWAGVSHVTIYDGRVWFANSDPFEDTNAADIYSYDPETGALRYERGLFTQDAGMPTVFGGRLFWPFEDPRFSMGAGEYAVTDGRAWRWRRLPRGRAMHLHAMAACGEAFVAVTGAWDGQLQISRDGGRTWHLASTYPRGEASFSRLAAVAPFRGRCFVGASAQGRSGAKLLEWKNGRLEPVPGWPEADATGGLTVHDGRLLAWNDSDGARTLLAFDGAKTALVAAGFPGRLRALASDGAHLWAVSGESGAGALWRSPDALSWTEVQRFEETPISVTAVAGAVFVGTYRAEGGALWGSRGVSLPRDPAAAAFGDAATNPTATADQPAAAGEIERLVAGGIGVAGDPGQLRRAFQRLAANSAPALGRRLAALYPEVAGNGRIRMFTDARVPQADLVRWYMMGAMAVNGHGRVPLDLLSVPFSGTRNRAEKYFEPAIAAIATVGWIGQDDAETVAALIRRLDRPDDPKWLRADIVAALSALTGRPFGHDVARWRDWWGGR